jgi:hypothetical protein
MTETPFSNELAHVTYFFSNFIFFGIMFSIFYSIRNGNIRSRISNRNVGARHMLIVLMIMLSVYYMGDRLMSDKIISAISNLGYTTLPLSTLSISLTAFYAVKVMFSRRIRFPDSIITMSISIIAFTVTIIMIINGNKL